MKIENDLEIYINKQKAIEPSDHLAELIINKLDNQKNITEKPLQHWRRLTVAASFAAAICLGVLLGNTYIIPSNKSTELIVNDSGIEHFSIYNIYENE